MYNLVQTDDPCSRCEAVVEIEGDSDVCQYEHLRPQQHSHCESLDHSHLHGSSERHIYQIMLLLFILEL